MFTILMPSHEFCIVVVRQAKVVGVCVLLEYFKFYYELYVYIYN